MLHETVLLSSTHHPTDSTTDIPSLTFHNVHTSSPLSQFKRSNTRCSALTRTHLFSAQTDKAVLNIYSLSKATLETTVSFPEKISALAASSTNGEFIAIGTEGGRIYVWEVATGRLVATPQIHLQEVTVLVFDKPGRLLVSGSRDSNVYVWSVGGLLDVREQQQRRPERLLERHRQEITAIVMGNAATGGGASDLCFTASKDGSVIAWDPHTGLHLRTYILPTPALSLCLDPADRALFCGTESGIICIDLHNPLSSSTHNIHPGPQLSDVPITVDPADCLWPSASAPPSPITALALSYEGNLLLSGEQSGKVGVWDVGTGRMFRQLYNTKAPVNGIFIQAPGELEEVAKTGVPVIPRPRYEAVLAAAGTTFDPSQYAVNVTLAGALDEDEEDEEMGGREWESSFGKETDLEWIEKGAREMMGMGAKVEGRKNVQQLEEELERMYEAYGRLSEVQKKTWGELVSQTASKGRS